MRTITAALFASGALAACASPPPPPPLAAAPPLAGTSWVAAEIDGAPLTVNNRVTIEFGADGRVAGDSGCNRFSGPYTQTSQHVRFGQLVSTQRACVDPVASGQEARYLNALNWVQEGGVSDGKLVLRGDRGALTFVRGGQAAGVPAPVRFSCEGGDQITVTFGERSARVVFPGGEDELAQTPAASGVSYESPRNSLRGKGDEITWNRARMAPKTCRKAG